MMSIRSAEPADVPAMLAIYDRYVRETAVSFEYVTPSEQEFRSRLQEHIAFYPWLVWEEDGQVLGYAYAGRPFERAAYAWNAEISCYLDERIHGKGVGRALYAELEAILLRQGIRRVYAVITSANQNSLAFHRALGYRDFAVFHNAGFKLGAWYDTIWLEKELCPAGSPNEFPAPWK